MPEPKGSFPMQLEIIAKVGGGPITVGTISVDVPVTLTQVEGKPSSYVIGLDMHGVYGKTERAAAAFVEAFEQD